MADITFISSSCKQCWFQTSLLYLFCRYPVGLRQHVISNYYRMHAILDDQNILERWKCIGHDRPAAAHSNRMREAWVEGRCLHLHLLFSFLRSVLHCINVFCKSKKKKKTKSNFVTCPIYSIKCGENCMTASILIMLFSVVLNNVYHTWMNAADIFCNFVHSAAWGQDRLLPCAHCFGLSCAPSAGHFVILHSVHDGDMAKQFETTNIKKKKRYWRWWLIIIYLVFIILGQHTIIMSSHLYSALNNRSFQSSFDNRKMIKRCKQFISAAEQLQKKLV